eukprot:3387694-Prymnesium_polylepis.1
MVLSMALLLRRASTPAWFVMMSASVPDVVYRGPTCEGLQNVVASVRLPDAGIILEVADSLVAEAGRGLFVRLVDGVASATLDQGPLCGYAQGAMFSAADSVGGKTVAFSLGTPETLVFFEGTLRTVRELLDDDSVEIIAGHVGERDAAGSLVGIDDDPLYEGPRFFIPAPQQPSPLDIMALGQMANDLAVGGDGDYAERSRVSNVLALVQRLERDPDSPAVLRPSRPISTLGKTRRHHPGHTPHPSNQGVSPLTLARVPLWTARTVTFENVAPMELGCEYGERYWGEQ